MMIKIINFVCMALLFVGNTIACEEKMAVDDEFEAKSTKQVVIDFTTTAEQTSPLCNGIIPDEILFNSLLKFICSDGKIPPISATCKDLYQRAMEYEALLYITLLDLSENTKVTDATLSKASRLQTLILGSRSPSIRNANSPHMQISDASVGKLTNLTHLNLNGCTFFFGSKVSVIAHLTNLRTLDLSGSDHVSQDELEKMPYLTSLDLSNNLTVRGRAAVQQLTNLTYLDLSHCGAACGVEVYIISHLTKLRTLNLCGNHNVIQHDLKQLTRLTNLDLSNNLAVRGRAAVQHLTNLTYLNASNCAISNCSVSCLVNLRELHIERTPNITHVSITNLTNLTTLSYQASSDFKPEFLTELVNLVNVTEFTPNTLGISLGSSPSLITYVLGGLFRRHF